MFSLILEARKIVNNMISCCESVDTDMPLAEAINSYSHNYEYSDDEYSLLQVLADNPSVANTFLALINKHKSTIINLNLVNDAIYKTVLQEFGEQTLTEILQR